jgi:hypothetical protein
VRPTAARSVAGVSAAFWAVAFFGLIDLLVVVVNDPGWRGSYLLESGWGVIFTFLVAVPLAVYAVRPAVGAGVVVAQLLAVALAMVAAALWTGYLPQLVPAALVAGDGALVGALAGVRYAAPPLDRALRMLVVAGAVGGGAFAASVVDGFPSPRPDITLGLDHLPMQASLGLVVITLGAVAAGAVGGRAAGWRVPVWTLVVSIGWVGSWSVVYPDLEGSMGRGLGAAAVAWAVLFAVIAEWRVRRTPVPAGTAGPGH